MEFELGFHGSTLPHSGVTLHSGGGDLGRFQRGEVGPLPEGGSVELPAAGIATDELRPAGGPVGVGVLGDRVPGGVHGLSIPRSRWTLHCSADLSNGHRRGGPQAGFHHPLDGPERGPDGLVLVCVLHAAPPPVPPIQDRSGRGKLVEADGVDRVGSVHGPSIPCSRTTLHRHHARMHTTFSPLSSSMYPSLMGITSRAEGS